MKKIEQQAVEIIRKVDQLTLIKRGTVAYQIMKSAVEEALQTPAKMPKEQKYKLLVGCRSVLANQLIERVASDCSNESMEKATADYNTAHRALATLIKEL